MPDLQVMTTYPATYCPDCGAELGTRTVDGRERRWCGGCEQVVWHTSVPCASVAVVCDEGVLVTRRAIEPGRGKWSLPGGHLEADEPPPVGAARELAEETGLEVHPSAPTLLDTFHVQRDAGKAIVSIGYVVERDSTSGTAATSEEVTEIEWVTPGAREGEVYLDDHADRVRRAWSWYLERDGVADAHT